MDRQFTFLRRRGVLPALGVSALAFLWMAVPPVHPRRTVEFSQTASFAKTAISPAAKTHHSKPASAHDEAAMPAPAMLTLVSPPRRMTAADGPQSYYVDQRFSAPTFALPTAGSELLLSVPSTVADDPPPALKKSEEADLGPQLSLRDAAPAISAVKPTASPADKPAAVAAPPHAVAAKAPEAPAPKSVLSVEPKPASTTATATTATATTTTATTTTAAGRAVSSARVLEFGKTPSASGAKVIELGPTVSTGVGAAAKTNAAPEVLSSAERRPTVTTLSEPIELEGSTTTRLELERPLLSSSEPPRRQSAFTRIPTPPDAPAVTTPEPAVEGESLLQVAASHARSGFELLGRSGLSPAQAEFLTALKLVTQTLDAGPNGPHAQALDAALVALKEGEDFLPRQGGPTDPAAIARGHRTPAARDVHGLSAAAALNRYLTFAQEQLAAAVSRQSVGAVSLYGLGKLHDRPEAALRNREAKALVFYQASLAAVARNSVAANDLGVLLARQGRYTEARTALEYSLSIRSQATAWHNLAVVYQSLGLLDRAQRAEQLATSGGRSGAGSARSAARSTTPSRGVASSMIAESADRRNRQ